MEDLTLIFAQTLMASLWYSRMRPSKSGYRSWFHWKTIRKPVALSTVYPEDRCMALTGMPCSLHFRGKSRRSSWAGGSS